MSETASSALPTDPNASCRLDVWLFHARWFKSRSLAAQICKSKGVRINGARVSRPSALVRPGDQLTFVRAKEIVALEVVALGTRRGPAPEAQALYRVLSSIATPQAAAEKAKAEARGGAESKAERDAKEHWRKTRDRQTIRYS